VITESDLVIVGAGFAGVWAAAAAAAVAADVKVDERDFRITVISPGDDLVIRPRLYQGEPSRARTALDPVLGPIGVQRVAGNVTGIDAEARQVAFLTDDGDRGSVGYRRLVLASGSHVTPPLWSEPVSRASKWPRSWSLADVTESTATFTDGSSIECATVIWIAGMSASERR
jgi:NADH dehydrogenase FAD-containing subunit